MKVIDLLNKIANGEEVPKEFISNGHSYTISKYPVCGKEIINYKDEDNDYLFGCEYELGLILNKEVEILDEEDEFIDIEEFCISYSLDYIDYRNIDVLKNYLNKDFQTIFDTLDKLIKNQKKIINKLKEEGK